MGTITTEKLNTLFQLQDEMDGEIWNVFVKYVKVTGKRCTTIESWNIESDHINFQDNDERNNDIALPFKFFTDTENALKELQDEIAAKAGTL